MHITDPDTQAQQWSGTGPKQDSTVNLQVHEILNLTTSCLQPSITGTYVHNCTYAP